MSKERNAWYGMIYRCTKPFESEEKDIKRMSYIRRGITVSEEFKDFDVFLEHVGKAPTSKHTLDRIDNDRGYERGNLRWVTSKENSSNRHNTKYYEYRGSMLSTDDIIPLLKCPIRTFESRLRRGWALEDAMSEGKSQTRKINDIISFDGKEMTISQWAKYLEISLPTLFDRVHKLGWSVEKALTTPLRSKS